MDVRISIIVPCYKQAEYLEDALQSVLDQEFYNWECIIVNDGSPDGTAEVAKKWCSRDWRFRYISQPNSGLSAARNKGISLAKGNYILPLDADDRISKDYVKEGIKALDHDNDLKLVYCKAEKFGEVNTSWELADFSLRKLASFNMIFCSAIFRKADWIGVNGYDENMVEGYEDWDFWISLLKKRGSVKRLPFVGFYYRIKPTSRTKELTPEKITRLENYLSVKHADFFINEIGSFFNLQNEINSLRKRESLQQELLISEKFVIDLFLHRFFKFTLFGKYNPK